MCTCLLLANLRDFTTLIVINEDTKQPNTFMVVHIGKEQDEGLTALFKVCVMVMVLEWKMRVYVRHASIKREH